MIISGIAFATLILLATTLLETRAALRRRRLRLADRAVTMPTIAMPARTSGSAGRQTGALTEGVGIGAGSTAVSIYELYAAADDHEHVLDALQERFDRVIPSDASPLEWLSYLGDKWAAGPASVQGVVNGLVGTLGEQGALDYLNALPDIKSAGIRAALFESKTHPGTDIHFVDSAGQDVGWPDLSVKSYADAHSFLSELGSHPQAATLVNHEVYEQLAASGELAELADRGLNVYDGHFSHLDHVADARDAIHAVNDASDVADHVPGVALAIFGWRTVETVQKWRREEASLQEAAVDVAGHGVRMVATGAAGFVGAKTGALIGTAVAPGVGTLIGGALGALVGAISAGRLARWLVERFKYGEVMAAVRAIGEESYYLLAAQGVDAKLFRERLADAIFGRGLQREQLDKQRCLAPRYASEDNVYALGASYRPPSPMGAMVRRHIHSLHDEIGRCAAASRAVAERALKLVQLRGEEHDYGFLGELAAANAEHFSPLLGNVRGAVIQYNDKIGSSPHHPYRFRSGDGKKTYESKDVFASMCIEARARSASGDRALALRLPLLGYVVRATMIGALTALLLLMWHVGALP